MGGWAWCAIIAATQCLENHDSKLKEEIPKEILKTDSSMDHVLYPSSWPHRFCSKSHLK